MPCCRSSSPSSGPSWRSRHPTSEPRRSSSKSPSSIRRRKSRSNTSQPPPPRRTRPGLISPSIATRALRSVGKHRGEILVGDPLRDELRGLIGLLAGLEETERAQDAVAGRDQVVAGKAGELAQLRDERLVDLASNLACARAVDTFVT